MIWDHINEIVEHWKQKYISASLAERKILSERIEIVRSIHEVGMLKNNDLFGWSGEHYQEIRQADYYCSCTSFGTSAPTGEQKQPCKHLYVLASGVLTNF
tara:strand:+ start:3970 stop:4269 length:300 start_codon:yes stop_codon:yes gene_type:complete